MVKGLKNRLPHKILHNNGGRCKHVAIEFKSWISACCEFRLPAYHICPVTHVPGLDVTHVLAQCVIYVRLHNMPATQLQEDETGLGAEAPHHSGKKGTPMVLTSGYRGGFPRLRFFGIMAAVK